MSDVGRSVVVPDCRRIAVGHMKRTFCSLEELAAVLASLEPRTACRSADARSPSVRTYTQICPSDVYTTNEQSQKGESARNGGGPNKTTIM
jgi:hypothetical protein